MQHYPWFLTTWRQYDTVVLRGDALRYLIMLHYGGLYLDLDVECFRQVASLCPNHMRLGAGWQAALGTVLLSHSN